MANEDSPVGSWESVTIRSLPTSGRPAAKPVALPAFCDCGHVFEDERSRIGDSMGLTVPRTGTMTTMELCPSCGQPEARIVPERGRTRQSGSLLGCPR